MFANKKIDRDLSKAMKHKFRTIRGVHGLDVPTICDPTIIFVTHKLACNIIQQCRKDQVLARVIAMKKKCVEGTSMCQVPFLLKQFLIDYVDAHNRGMEFHYPWILIFLLFTTWEDMKDAQFWGLRGKLCLATKYHNFWYTKNKWHQTDNNIEFFLYVERI